MLDYLMSNRLFLLSQVAPSHEPAMKTIACPALFYAKIRQLMRNTKFKLFFFESYTVVFSSSDGAQSIDLTIASRSSI